MQVLEKPTIIMQLSHNLSFANDTDVNQKLLTRYRLYDYLTPNDTANKLILQSVIDEWSDYCNKLYATTIYEYNPIWNVDGTTETTRKLEYGKVDTKTNGLVVTTEQKVAAVTQTEQKEAAVKQTEQKTAAMTQTDYGRVDTLTHNDTMTDDQTRSGTHSYKNNGYDLTSSTPTSDESFNDGASSHTDTGTGSSTLSGTDVVTNDMGKIEETNDMGKVEVTNDMGKVEVTNSGNDVDTASGEDNESIKEVRSGNIGVTSTQSLIQQERDIIIDVIDFYIAKFATAFDINNAILWGKWELE